MEQETPVTENNQVTIIKNSIEVFKTAPEVLLQNQQRTAKAVTVGNNIVRDWNLAWAIEDEDARLTALAAVDERSNKFIGNCATALKQERELRSAITQLMDKFKTYFTTEENTIDATKPGTLPANVQKHRNSYASEVKKISDRKRQEAEDKANKLKEHATITSECEQAIHNYYGSYLRNTKNRLLNNFNAATLETIDEIEKALYGYNPVLADDKFNLATFDHGVLGRYHSKEEIKDIYATVVIDELPGFRDNYKAEMILQRDDLLDKVASKRNELEEAKKLADELAELELKKKKDKKAQDELAQKQQEQKKLDDARLLREKQEQEELDRQELERKQAATQKIDIKAQGASTMAMFAKEEVIADTKPTVSMKEDFEIVVLHPVGYTQIFQLWFEGEGRELSVDDMGKVKLEQMKAWAEKKALKEGTKIESKFLRYDTRIKAKTTKEKAVKA